MSRPDSHERTDSELLARALDEPAAFGLFYRRHYRAVLGYLVSRTGRADLAADLCAEVFASALEQAESYDSSRAPARAWLFVIARSRMIDSIRRQRVEDGARGRLGMPPLTLTDEDLERVEQLVSSPGKGSAEWLVEDLPPDQREAVLARVVDERDYAEIAAALDTSEAVVRKRVSRGLAALRHKLKDSR